MGYYRYRVAKVDGCKINRDVGGLKFFPLVLFSQIAGLGGVGPAPVVCGLSLAPRCQGGASEIVR